MADVETKITYWWRAEWRQSSRKEFETRSPRIAWQRALQVLQVFSIILWVVLHRRWHMLPWKHRVVVTPSKTALLLSVDERRIYCPFDGYTYTLSSGRKISKRQRSSASWTSFRSQLLVVKPPTGMTCCISRTRQMSTRQSRFRTHRDPSPTRIPLF